MKQEIPTEPEALQMVCGDVIRTAPLTFQLAPQEKLAGLFLSDALLQASWESKTVDFAVEYRRLSTPLQFQDALLRIQAASCPEGVLPLLIVPYLKPEQLQLLDERGVSGIDLCGNMAVTVAGQLKVFRCGQVNQFRNTSAIKNIYRGRTSLVARSFALQDAFDQVQDIREEIIRRDVWASQSQSTPIGLSTVSKALKTLENDLLVSRDAKQIRVLQRDQLLKRLIAGAQDIERPKSLRLKVNFGESSLAEVIAENLVSWSGPVVATGLCSANRYTTMQRGPVIEMYGSDIDELATRFGGEQVNRFENLILIESKNETDYFDARTADGFPWASPLQCYIELMGGDKRDKETAVQVLDLLAKSEDLL
ncbi:MAG: hypothetical protein ABJZ55_26060 [Fuerstiella sp.]